MIPEHPHRPQAYWRRRSVAVRREAAPHCFTQHSSHREERCRALNVLLRIGPLYFVEQKSCIHSLIQERLLQFHPRPSQGTAPQIMSDMAGFAQSSAPLSSSKTPEPRPEQQLANGPTNSPSTPGTFTPFDWEDFETRYIQALEKADNDERLLLHEFEELVKVCHMTLADPRA